MIVSHAHRFIFLKTRKTAGTSVEIALSRYCGDRDVITGFGAADEALRAEAGGRPAQNDSLPIRRIRRDDLRRAWRHRERPRALSHMPAADARRFVGDDAAWNDYLKFTIVRNPWDAVISYYYWRVRQIAGEPPTIGEFIRSDGMDKLALNWAVYSIDDRVVADEVVRYEDLAAGLESVRQRIGLPEPLELPRAKSGTRGDRRDHRELLTSADADLVATMFRREIDRFGYTFR